MSVKYHHMIGFRAHFQQGPHRNIEGEVPPSFDVEDMMQQGL